MSVSKTLSAVFCVALTLLAIGPSHAEPPPSSDSVQPKLTPERAREALLAMMRSKAGKDLGWFDGTIPDEMAKMKIEAEKDGWYAWTAAFRFHPAKALYTLTIMPRPGVRACAFEYNGSFAQKDGAWSATAPKLVQAGMQPGN